MPPVVLQAPLSTARRWQVRFDWDQDRFGHRIELVEREMASAQLVSLEGTPSDARAVGPAMQQLHLEDRGSAGRVALLVGMSGREHWSMSVEIAAGGEWLVFDVACRLGSDAGPLGSRYRMLTERPAELKLETDPGRCRAPAAGWELTTLAAGSEPAAGLKFLAGELQINPPTTASTTVRWKYRVALIESQREGSG